MSLHVEATEQARPFFGRLSRDGWLAICLVAALTIVLVVTYARQETPPPPPLSSASALPNGTRAFRLWLDALGYTVDETSPATFAVPDEVGLVLMLEPTEPILDYEWSALDDWVEQGGVLILAGDRYQFPSWADHYDLWRTSWGSASLTTTLRLQHPLFTSPPLTVPSLLTPDSGALALARDDLLVHAASPSGAVIVSLPQGAGRVILSTTSYPFTNAALHRAGAPALLLNLLTLAGPPERVWFNEWHHGVRSQDSENTPLGIDQWLRRTLAGRAILFALAVIFLALVLQGRNFGRPLPLPKPTLRRTPLEYVTAIANLQRRAGHRAAIARDYAQRLKRTLGRRYRLDPALPDEEFVARLIAYNPALDQAALRQLLQRLNQRELTETALVELAAAVARWTE